MEQPSKMWQLRYELKLARINFRKAETRHLNEQSKGQHDPGVKQTKRMYHAVVNLQRASRRLDTAMHELRLHARLTGEIAKELTE